MKLYHISQSSETGYDTFDSAVVAAKSPKAASLMHPHDGADIRSKKSDDWTNDPEKVTVKHIGYAQQSVKAGVICSSFNAG